MTYGVKIILIGREFRVDQVKIGIGDLELTIF